MTANEKLRQMLLDGEISKEELREYRILVRRYMKAEKVKAKAEAKIKRIRSGKQLWLRVIEALSPDNIFSLFGK